jgi:hypothetical protein
LLQKPDCQVSDGDQACLIVFARFKMPIMAIKQACPPQKNRLAIPSQKYYIARQPFTGKQQGAYP